MAYLIIFTILISAIITLSSYLAESSQTEKVRIPLDSSFTRQKNR